MIVRFFGHSMTKHKQQDTSPKTFVDLVQEHYKCLDTNDTYHALGRCSEERILFFLKKVKPMDVAVIFHSWPTFTFVPGFVRDVGKSRFEDDEIEFLHKAREGYFWRYDNFEKSLPTNSSQSIEFPIEEANEILEQNRRYFYHPDLQMNRFMGALIQIDQYCTSKKIPVIHFTNYEFPKWFKFTSGIVDTDTVEMSFEGSRYYVGYQKSENAINAKGNVLIAKKIIYYIENYETLHITLD
jgi:hypothetical protein